MQNDGRGFLNFLEQMTLFLSWLFVCVVWIIFGPIVWFGLLARAIGVHTLTTLLASVAGKKSPSGRAALKHAGTYYARSFKNIYLSIYGDDDSVVNDPLLDFDPRRDSLGNLVYQIFLLFVFNAAFWIPVVLTFLVFNYNYHNRHLRAAPAATSELTPPEWKSTGSSLLNYVREGSNIRPGDEVLIQCTVLTNERVQDCRSFPENDFGAAIVQMLNQEGRAVPAKLGTSYVSGGVISIKMKAGG